MCSDNKNEAVKKAITLLILLNLFFLILGFFIKIPSPPRDWLKGPLTNRFSVYSCENAPKVFFISTAFLVDLYFIILFILHAVTKIKKNLNTGISVLLIMFALGSSFLLTENLLRLYMKHSQARTWYRPHPLLYWWNRPNVKNFENYSDGNVGSINSQGFRYYRDMPSYKVENEYRIFVLGNSSAFGVGVDDDKTFAAHLERMLGETFGAKYKICCVNAACPGHTTYQNVIEFKTMILPLHPDMVIIANNNDAALEYIEEKERACRNPFIRQLNIILYNSDYYLLFQRLILDLNITYLTNSMKTEKPKLVHRVSLDDYKANIKEMIKLGEYNKCKVIFVNMPVNYVTLQKLPFLRTMFYRQEYQDALIRLCGEYNQIIVDIDKDWNTHKDSDLFEITQINGIKTEAHFHPSSKGHLKMAQQIYNAIMQNKLVHLKVD